MVDRIKSMSEKKIEKSLDIDDDIDNLDKKGDKSPDASNIEEDMAAKIAERQRHSQEIRENLEKLKEDLTNNEDFAEAIYKELVVTDMEILKMVRSELDINPSPRYLETISAMSNGVVTAVAALRDIGKTKHNQEIDIKKLEIRDKAASGGILTGTAGAVASFADVIRAAKELVNSEPPKKEPVKTIEAEVTFPDREIVKEEKAPESDSKDAS